MTHPLVEPLHLLPAMPMTNNETTGHAELPKVLDDGTNNNYGSWKGRAYYKLQKWGLWKNIEGQGSHPPAIPILHLATAYHAPNDKSHLTTAHYSQKEEDVEMTI